jgi:hypothetical protein
MSKLNHVPSPATVPPSTPLGGARITTHLDQPLSLEDDDVVRTMRQYGHKGPVTREMYIGFIHAGEPGGESPPGHSTTADPTWPARRRSAY